MMGRTFTIDSSSLRKCPESIILPQHYRRDGSCLHALVEREPVIFRADFLDDDVREAYNGQRAIILNEIDHATFPYEQEGTRYLIEFGSGNRLVVSLTEVTPDDGPH